VFIDRAEPRLIAGAVDRLVGGRWDEQVLRSHAGRYSFRRFADRMAAVVAEERRVG
jgi:hypothetical protein